MIDAMLDTMADAVVDAVVEEEPSPLPPSGQSENFSPKK